MVQLSSQQIKPEKSRARDPNVLQRIASNPASSVWVGASAGSGKTKVLTDRILRLLLPQSDGRSGTAPYKVLALTFTKAAASEMAQRIGKRLSEWAVIPLEELKENLQQLLGQAATEEQVTAARRLFAAVVDTPGGLKIMTIHSFCQSVLSRFPLEAGLPPSFKALEENQAKILLGHAQTKILQAAEEEKGTPLSNAVRHLATAQNEEQFKELLKKMMGERRQFQNILDKNFGVGGLYTALCKEFEIPAGQTAEDLIYAACADNTFDEAGLRQACAALAGGTPASDIPKGIAIQHWLDSNQKERAARYDDYKKEFLTGENTIRAAIITKKHGRNFPDSVTVLENEAQRIFDLEKKLKSVIIAALTRDLFLVSHEILQSYTAQKEQDSALDFDDLILRTLDLLQGKTVQMQGLEVAPWVRFKLDQGIDHILVDEAQDTNPEQWEIIQSLCDDFFDGIADTDTERTLFVVGDKKQSIFSFQRASPEKFQTMRHWFETKITSTKNNFEPVDFITSFRSVPAVLELVDRTFEDPSIHAGLDDIPTEHISYRRSQPGLVELWPIFETPEKETLNPWAPPITESDSSSGAAQMAAHVGETIKKWIDTKEEMESHARPIEAGDIMILVRSRTAFIDQLVRALKTRNIPVSGVDRMILSEQLVVQDLCAAAAFALLPEDDLNLAAFLKSPFIGWSEEQLFDIAYNRQGASIWQKVKDSGNKTTIDYLSGLIPLAGKETPYRFFSMLLQQTCPTDDKSGLHAIKKRLGTECLDPLDEFLNSALLFGHDNIPTLQNFIQTQLHDESEIKRQMEESSNAVRIMTVHGAKGLQAPIVILPDTVRNTNTQKPERILWPDRSEAALPYFCPQSSDLPPPCEAASNVLKKRQDEEYRRLLYVALTRAENRLYVGGYKSSKPVIDESWYRYVETGFSKLPDITTEEVNNIEIKRYINHGTKDPDRAHKDRKEILEKLIAAPSWLFQPMPEEPNPPRPLTPSRPSGQEAPALSPLLSSADNKRFQRGNITHKLLQILPDLPPEQREQAARRYVAQPGHNLPKEKQDGIVNETMAVLTDPLFTAIFAKGSRAEVPITGLLADKTLISGQIDRLLVTDKEILIIDYKTNRPPPDKIEDVPEIYINQMAAYAATMRQIYPNKTIKCALVWTDGAKMMVIPTP